MSKLRINNILRTALESQDGEQFDVVTSETVTEVERELIEMDETHEEAREAVEVVEELEERHEQVEELEQALESFNRDGGMSRDAAILYQMRLEQLTAGLESVPGCNHVSVSVESFGGTGGRLQASLEQAEKTKEAKAGIWQTILRMIRAAKDAIVNFFGRVFKSNTSLRKKAEEFKSAAGKIRNEKTTEKKITGGTWARNLTDKNGNVNAASTPKVIKDLGAMLTKVQVAANQLANSPTDSVFASFNSTLRSIDGMLPGSYQVSVNGERVDITRAEVKNPEEIDALTTRQVAEVASSIVDALRQVDSYAKVINGAMDKLDKTAEKIAKEADSKNDAEHATTLRKAIPAIRRAALDLPKIVTDAARSGLVYCGKSLKGVSDNYDKDSDDTRKHQADVKQAILDRRTAPSKK